MSFSAGQILHASDLYDPFVGELRNNSAIRTSTGTEAVCNTVTITVGATTERYKATWNFTVQSNVVNDAGRVRIRHQSGSSLTSSGTEDAQQSYNILAANKGQSGNVLIATITGLAAGTWTIGGTLQRTIGTGTNQINGTATDQEYLLIERIT